MPKLNEIYGGDYLVAEDIGKGRELVVTIEDVSVMETGEGKKKAVLRFTGKKKTLPLNITNANMVTELLGSNDTDDWEGRRICLYTCMVDFQGRRVLAIRIKGAPTKKAVKPPPEPEPEDDEPVQELDDSDIPF